MSIFSDRMAGLDLSDARTAEGHAAFSMRGTDDRWVMIQLNTFTNWVNEQIRPLDIQVKDLGVEFSDGIKLCQLMEVLKVSCEWDEERRSQFTSLDWGGGHYYW